jgi:hypothetical protein
MKGDWTWADVFRSLYGVLQWTIAILSVVGTLALFSWIFLMIVRKDRAK